MYGLPFARDHRPSEQINRIPNMDNATAGNSLRPLIFLVEYEPGPLKELAPAISMRWRVQQFDNAADVSLAISHNPPDLLVGSEVDAFTVLAMLPEVRDIPVVLLLEQAEMECGHKALRSHHGDLLSRPFSSAEVISSIEKQITQSSVHTTGLAA